MSNLIFQSPLEHNTKGFCLEDGCGIFRGVQAVKAPTLVSSLPQAIGPFTNSGGFAKSKRNKGSQLIFPLCLDFRQDDTQLLRAIMCTSIFRDLPTEELAQANNPSWV